MKTESEMTRLVDKALRSRGVMVEAIVGSRMNRSGRPDRWLCWKGGSCWVEYKRGGVSLRPDQLAWHKDCIKRKGKVFICRFRKWDYGKDGYLQIAQLQPPAPGERGRAGADWYEVPLRWVDAALLFAADASAVDTLLRTFEGR